MARVRSPNYPAISLREAIDRVQQLFSKAQTQKISREQAVEAMGYDGLHGASLGAISALMKYGLLDRIDSDVKVSDRAMSLIAPHNDEERQTAIHQAAFNPPLFSEIHERFLGEVPNDDKLRSYLLRKNFSSSALGRVIRSYRETMDLVSEECGDYNGQSGSPSLRESPLSTPTRAVRPPQISPPTGAPFHVAITTDAIEVSGRLTTPEEVDRLVKVLELNKVMITPVHGAFATEYTDDEEGRRAEERDQIQSEEASE